MKLAIDKFIQCNRYSVVIKFKEFGSTSLTPEEEQKLINDFCPKFKLSDVTFTDKYKLEDGKIIKDSVGGEDITLTTPNKEIAINELLEVGYTIHISEVSDDELHATLNTKDLICKAKIQLFIDKLAEKISSILAELAKTLDDFEKIEEIEVG